MKRNYFTAFEFNQANMSYLTQDKHYDEWGRYITFELFRQYNDKLIKPIIKLEKNLNTDVKKGDTYFDIMATFTDYTRAAIECKYRFDNSYNTHFMNSNKYWLFNKRLKEGIINNGHLISFYADGKAYVSGVFRDNHHEETHLQNITTNADDATDGQKTDKSGVYYKPDMIFYYVYRLDYSTKQYYPIFSTEPIDIQKLEDDFNNEYTTMLF